jgi:hypothetical protein
MHNLAQKALRDETLVLIVDSGREHLLGIALADHVIVEDLAYLLRSRGAVTRLHQRRLVLLADAVNAKFDESQMKT